MDHAFNNIGMYILNTDLNVSYIKLFTKIIILCTIRCQLRCSILILMHPLHELQTPLLNVVATNGHNGHKFQWQLTHFTFIISRGC